jgi:hypothetical protein
VTAKSDAPDAKKWRHPRRGIILPQKVTAKSGVNDAKK